MTAAAPLVLVTTAQHLADRPLRRTEAVTGRNYADALDAVGLLPVLVPTLPAERAEAFVGRADGLLLSGGGDVDPARYGQAPHPRLGVVDPERDAVELALYRAARARGLPILGICRGAQVMAVAEGGSLRQHLPSFEALHGHEQAARDGRRYHEVRLEPNGALATAFGNDRLQVNSYHHQGIEAPGPALRPIAWSEDGLIEAVEARDGSFAVGVQWHPEMGFAIDPTQLAPFRALAWALGVRQGTSGDGALDAAPG